MTVTPSVLVLRAAGTNCDRETAYAFEHFGARADVHHVNRMLADPEQLLRHHVLALPGGFAYGDDVAAGAVWATELGTRLADPLCRFLDDGGLVMGICNGFQVLVRLGLLPGLDHVLGAADISLTGNVSQRYEDRWVRLAVSSQRCVFVNDMSSAEMTVAHAEGRLVVRDEGVAQRLVDEERVVFRYADTNGNPTQTYPDNPNGSLGAIAGLTDRTGRVLGLMPHPERSFFPWHHPEWTRQRAKGQLPDLADGAALFRNACEWVAANR